MGRGRLPCLFLAAPVFRGTLFVANRHVSFLGSSLQLQLQARNRCRVRRSICVVAIVSGANGTGDSDDNEGGSEGTSGGESSRPSPDQVRAGRVNNLRERLDQVTVPEDDIGNEGYAKRYLERESQLLWVSTSLFRELFQDFDEFFLDPRRQLVAASLAILFGFFAATSATTIIGSVADWDPLAAAVLLVWTEAFTRYYYGREDKSLVLRLINAFKIGLIYGCAVDACKLST